MDIDKIGAMSAQFKANKAKTRENAAKSFQDLLQLKLRQQPAAYSGQADPFAPDSIYRAGGIEALSARARVQQSAGGDVTDFLGLINQDAYLSAQDVVTRLVDTGAVSAYDAAKLNSTVFPGRDDLMGYLLNEPGFTDLNSIDPRDTLKRLEAMISNEQFTYGHILGRYGKQTTAVRELSESHARVLEALVNSQKA